MKKYINPRNLLLFGLILVVVAFFWMRKQSLSFEDDVPEETPEDVPEENLEDVPEETPQTDVNEDTNE